MNHMKNILRGVSDALVIAQSPRGYQIQQNGAKADAAKLANDFATIGGDMRRVLKNDKQAYQRTR
jgi:hypothetical protein